MREGVFRGGELVQGIARVCAMNLMLHGIGSEKSVPIKVADVLAADPGGRDDFWTTTSKSVTECQSSTRSNNRSTPITSGRERSHKVPFRRASHMKALARQ